MLLACPSSVPIALHAQAAQVGLSAYLPGVYVAGYPLSDGALADAVVADSHEQGLSLVMQRLQQLQLQRTAIGDSSASLLSRASLIAAMQPCNFHVMAGGDARKFCTFWLGLADVASSKYSVGSSPSLEVAQTPQRWGKSARSSSLDSESTVQITQGWRALIQAWHGD